MEMSKKQAEFWAFIIIMCVAVAITVLLVDFGIKAAILQESNKLRLVIEEEEVRRSGRKRTEANANGAANDTPNDAPIPGDVLVVDTQRMEAGNVPNGTEESTNGTPNRRAKSSRQTHPRAIPSGD